MTIANQTALALFEHAFKTYAERPAFTCLGVTSTYREIDEKSAALAAYFRQVLHLQAGDRIALQMPNITQYPIAIYAALRAGLVIVNVNPLYTERELIYQLKDSGAKALVVLANVAANVSRVIAQTDVEHVIVTEIADFMPWPKRFLINAVVKHLKKMVPPFTFVKPIAFVDALAAGAALPKVEHEPKPEDLMVLQYTGGTTGVAKGAMLSQFNLYSNVQQIKERLPSFFSEDKEIFATPLPLYHIYALNLHLLAGFSNGAHSVLIPNPRDLDALFKALIPFKITVFVGINTLFNAMLNHKDIDRLDFSALKVTSAGGMALNTEIAKRWRDKTHCDISEGYGLTETSPVLSANPLEAIRAGSIGTPLPKTFFKIVNEHGQILPNGEPGELCVKGPQVMRGYWNKPEETANAFDAEGWFKTGDIAIIQDDGYARIVDRKKDMVIVSGFNVYPNEVEDVAMQHAGVLEAAVIGVATESGNEAIKIFVVRKDPSLTELDVIAHCKKNLTAYKVPKFVEFRDSLPKTNVGKILRRELREQ